MCFTFVGKGESEKISTKMKQEDKKMENIGHIVEHVTKSVEKQVRRKSSKKSRLFKPKYEKLDEQNQEEVIEAIRNIGESSLIVKSNDSPNSTPTSQRRVGVSETCEIERKLVQKILKNYMITEHMREYYFVG